MEDLFRQFWWLMFPLAGLVYGLVGMMQQSRNQSRALDVLKTYAEQGKEPPAEVLKALSEHSDVDFSHKSARNPSGPAMSAWWTFFVFLALTAGFGVGMNGFGDDARSAFLTVTIVMGVLAAGAFIMALFATFRGK